MLRMVSVVIKKTEVNRCSLSVGDLISERSCRIITSSESANACYMLPGKLATAKRMAYNRSVGYVLRLVVVAVPL
jgi:hypothetical protein